MRRRAHPQPVEDDTGRRLVTRAIAAYLAQRDVDHVRKRGPAPVACDVTTRALLLDLDAVEEAFGGRPHRNRMQPLRIE